MGRHSPLLIAIIVALVWALVWPLHDRVGGHSGLRFSSPLDGATLGDTPTHVQLTFLERPEPSLSTIRVVDTLGVAYQAGGPEPVESDPLSLAVVLRPLGRGVYTVHWRVVSAVDGHASTGLYVFGVLVEPGPSGSADQVETTASTSEALARFLFLSGLVLLLGAAAAHIGRFGFGREVALAGVGWVVSIAGLALLASAQWRVADVGLAELSGTAIGRALLWRTVAIGAAGIAIGLAAFGIRAERRYLVHLGLYGIVLPALAAVAVHSAAGHAAAGRWHVATTIAFQAVHVAAVGIWVGGLAALLAGVRGSPSDLKAEAVGRFSTMAAAGFVVVMTTGIVRSVHEMSGWGDLTSTAYGRVVLAKMALLMGVGALGALHRSHTVPMTAWSLRPLRLVGSLELALAGVALAAAGFLGALFPPAAAQSIAGIDVSGADFGTSVRARLTAASYQPGPNRFVVRINDYDSKAPVAADRVSLRFSALDDTGVATTSLPLRPGPDDSYIGSGANLTFDGRWRVSVLVERDGGSVEVPLEVETRGLPQFLSVLRPPGRAPSYTIEVRGIGHVRITADPEAAGPSRLHITCFNGIYEALPIDDITVTTGSAPSARQQPVKRLNQNEFAADVELQAGENRIAVIARTANGTRLRAAIAISVAR